MIFLFIYLFKWAKHQSVTTIFADIKKASPNGKYNNCYLIHTIISDPVKPYFISLMDLKRADLPLNVFVFVFSC